MKIEKNKWFVACTAIVVIGAIEIVALLQGVNGLLMTVTVGAIAGIAGYKLKK